MTGEPLALQGCTPTPLASYLKALGVLRLVSSAANHVSGEAADRHARGWWQNEQFHLRTMLNRDALLHFFLHDYAPSPIIAPWNGRAGFLEGDAGESSSRGGAVLMRAVEASGCRRLDLMRRTVRSLRNNDHLSEYNRLRALAKRLQDASKTLKGNQKRLNDAEKKRVDKEAQTIKSILLPSLRSETDIHHVDYVDACYVLSGDEAAAPLLGSGGNDGSRDFGVNFAERLRELVDFADGSPAPHAEAELESALLGVIRRAEEHGSMGQFSPGQGGPNATTGYEGYNPLNAWDVILAIEGTLPFAGALTRRWGATGGSRAAFPFTFELIGAGTGSLSPEDPTRPRGEVWTPIWSKPATFAETAAIFAEGRLTLGERAARTGLDAARSVARIGAARGIGSFERYCIIQPDRKMPYQATPLGRFNAPDRPRRDLVSDLETGDWLSRARRLVDNKKTAPARARQAMRRLDDALFQMTVANRESEGTRNALVALGGLVGWIASNSATRKALTPPPPISSDWIRQADDGSAEFRIAAALGSLGLPALARPARPVSTHEPEATQPDGHISDDSSSTKRETTAVDEPAGAPEQVRSNPAPPMAAHLAPLKEQTFLYRRNLSARRAWAEDDAPPTMVWGAGPFVPNLIAVLERRLVEASTRGLEDKPLSGVTAARLSDVEAFLSADFDDARCAALLTGLVWASPARLRYASGQSASARLPFAYAALKPLFTPAGTLRAAGVRPETARMPVPPGLVARLRAGGNSRDGRATDDAVRLAQARARASGLPTVFDGRAGARESTIDGSRMGAGIPADRLAGALLIPISDRDSVALIKRAYPDALADDNNATTEDTTHAT